MQPTHRLPIEIDPRALEVMNLPLDEHHLKVFMISPRCAGNLFDVFSRSAGADTMFTACHLLQDFNPTRMGTALYEFMKTLPFDIRTRMQKIADIMLLQRELEKLQSEAREIETELQLLDKITKGDTSALRLELQNKRDDIVREMERIQEHITMLLA